VAAERADEHSEGYVDSGLGPRGAYAHYHQSIQGNIREYIRPVAMIHGKCIPIISVAVCKRNSVLEYGQL
jgi:hypothetical protein